MKNVKKMTWAAGLTLIVAVSFLVGSWYSQRGTGTAPISGARTILYYVDPMHPAYKSDKPGIAPDCGMELVPVYDDGGVGSAGASASSVRPGTVKVSPEQQQLIGVRAAAVTKTPGTHIVRTVGRIATDENRIHRILAGSEGWIRKISEGTTGTLVKQDQMLATLYSRDLLAAEQGLFYALNVFDRSKKEGVAGPEQNPASNSQVQAAEDTLRNLGMSDIQIREISQTRTPTREIVVSAPVTGVILTRNVFPGMRLERGAELYRLGDLSRVWILADVFRNEAKHFRPGTVARVTLSDDPEEMFQARVSEVLPQFDATARALKVRLEVNNPGYVLRPDMFVDVELPLALPPAITVPVDAVVDAGAKRTVYVDKGNGVFEPRKVETGWRAGGQVEIVKGLMVGEKIVVSGTFLIDSESRMKAAAAGFYGETSDDPVCGMEVDQGKTRAAGLTAEYQGQMYYFCSDDCKTKFAKEPTKYAWKVNADATTPAGKRLSEVQWKGGKAKEAESAHVGHMHPMAPSAGTSDAKR